ncbi:GIY-YIG nuclease family protein, partial [Patescibacteria group bacterium]|nr:GIY-YIG nuclease family protein [Patescibacteria group bacterium]
VGVCGHLESRVKDHKQKTGDSFTAKYNINKLVYYEEYDYVYDAIDREKQLKRWTRKKKVDLIKSVNPKFEDLSQDWEL